MPYSIICLLLTLWGLCACTGIHKATRLGDTIQYGTVGVSLNQPARDSIMLHYMGCSGFLIRKGDQAILHDPFFSNTGPLLTSPFQTISSDTSSIIAFFQSIFPAGTDTQGLIKLLLISHTHYDHMMDAPFIYHNILNQDTLLMLGNKSMTRIMQLSHQDGHGDTGASGHIVSTQDHLTQADSVGQSYSSRNGKIRILPIATEHAPHFFCIHLFKGEVKTRKTSLPKKVCQWKEGVNIAYLIDFLDPLGEVEFRLHISGAAASPPGGFVPKSVLDAHPIDLAIICVASQGYVKNYPEGLLQHLRPRHLLLSHWENFFRPVSQLKTQARVVPLTNVKRFLKKVTKVTSAFRDSLGWTMPNPGTTIVIRF